MAADHSQIVFGRHPRWRLFKGLGIYFAFGVFGTVVVHLCLQSIRRGNLVAPMVVLAATALVFVGVRAVCAGYISRRFDIGVLVSNGKVTVCDAAGEPTVVSINDIVSVERVVDGVVLELESGGRMLIHEETFVREDEMLAFVELIRSYQG